MKTIGTISLVLPQSKDLHTTTNKSSQTSGTVPHDQRMFSKLLESINAVEVDQKADKGHVELQSKLEALQKLLEEITESLQDKPEELVGEHLYPETILPLVTKPENKDTGLFQQNSNQLDGVEKQISPNNLEQWIIQFNRDLPSIQSLVTNKDGSDILHKLVSNTKQLEQFSTTITTLLNEIGKGEFSGLTVKQQEQLKQVIQQMENFSSNLATIKQFNFVDSDSLSVLQELSLMGGAKFDSNERLTKQLSDFQLDGKGLTVEVIKQVEQQGTVKNSSSITSEELDLQIKEQMVAAKPIEKHDGVQTSTTRQSIGIQGTGLHQTDQVVDAKTTIMQTEQQGLATTEKINALDTISNSLSNELEVSDIQYTGQTSDAKLAGVQEKQDAVKAPIIRMTNLIEDLTKALPGSFRLTGNEQSTQLRVNINPEQFGHLDIRITSIEGKIQAQILTSNLLAKETLEQQINHLRLSLNQQGVNVDEIEITYNQQQSFDHHTNPEQRFRYQQKRTKSVINPTGYQQVPEETMIEPRRPINSGLTKVDYTI